VASRKSAASLPRIVAWAAGRETASRYVLAEGTFAPTLSAEDRFPPVHMAVPEGALRVEAVQKLLRVFARTCFVRFCEALKRSESKESRKILLCSILCKFSPSFYTASVDLTRSRHRLAMTAICAFLPLHRDPRRAGIRPSDTFLARPQRSPPSTLCFPSGSDL
jgi:hypothetical protein